MRLVYQLPIDALQRSLRGKGDSDLEQAIVTTLRTIGDRLPGGLVIQRLGGTGFTLDLPAQDDARMDEVRQLIEASGKLEMRMVADADYVSGDVRFDLATERARLQAWLEAGGRERLLADVHALDAFHDDAEKGPLAGANLRWFVRRVLPDSAAAGRWGFSLRQSGSLQPSTVALFTDEDWHDGAIPPHIQRLPVEQRVLLELVAVNMHEMHFANADLDPASVKKFVDRTGPAIDYQIVGARAAQYADWTERNIGKFSVILWNDEVRQIPRFVGRIAGRGRITGALGEAEVDAVVKLLRTAPLPVTPRFVATQVLPAEASKSAGK